MKKLLFILLLITSLSCSSDNDVIVLRDYVYSEREYELYQMINDYRVENGLNTLTLVNHISALCYDHNQQMIVKGIGHYDLQPRFDEVKSLGYESVSEIVGVNYTSNVGFFNALKNTPSCDRILIGEYVALGFSITIDEVTNKKYYTLIFAN